MKLSFEHNRSSWEIRVQTYELLHIYMLMKATSRKPKHTNVVWLTRVSPTKRAWIVSESNTTAWITADASPSDPDFALPIPDDFIGYLADLGSEEEAVDIFYNEKDDTIVGRAGDRYCAIDHPEDVVFTEDDLPYRALPHGTNNSSATATVQMEDLMLFADQVMTWYPELPATNEIHPFVSLQIGDGQFAWTMDRRRMNMYRTTGAIPAVTTGNIVTEFFPYRLARLLRTNVLLTEASIFIGSEDADDIYFCGDDWGIRTINTPEVAARWYTPFVYEVKKCGGEVALRSSKRTPTHFQFEINNYSCYASLHETEDGSDDYGRLTYVVAHEVEPTLSMYEKLNSLNATLVGASVVLRNNEIRVVADVPLTSLRNLSRIMTPFVAAIERIGLAYEILPLFATSLDDSSK